MSDKPVDWEAAFKELAGYSLRVAASYTGRGWTVSPSTT